jgi:hypothetical protein
MKKTLLFWTFLLGCIINLHGQVKKIDNNTRNLRVSLPCTIDISDVSDTTNLFFTTDKDSTQKLKKADIKTLRQRGVGNTFFLDKKVNILLSGSIILDFSGANSIIIDTKNYVGTEPQKNNSEPKKTNLDSLKNSRILEIISSQEHSTIEDALLLYSVKDKPLDSAIVDKFIDYYKEGYKITLKKGTDNTIELDNPDKANPFIKKFLETKGGGSEDKISIGGGSSQGSIFSPTGVADALGTFIANRFKQEINVAFLDRFKRDLEDSVKYRGLDKFRGIKALLPETKKVLSANEPYQYTTYFQALREAFQEDFNHLPKNGVNFLTLQIDKQPTFERKNLFIGASLGLDIAADMIDKRPFSQTITGLSQREYIKALGDTSKTTNVYASIKALSLLSSHLENKSHSNWNSLTAITGSNYPKIFQVFLGLIVAKDSAKLQDITFINDKTKADKDTTLLLKLMKNADKSDKLFTSLFDLSKNINIVNDKISAINKDLEKKLKTDTNFKTPASDWIDLVNKGMSVVSTAYDIVGNIAPNASMDKKFFKITSDIKGVLKIADYVAEKKYGLAFTSVVELYINHTKMQQNANEQNENLKTFKSEIKELEGQLKSSSETGKVQITLTEKKKSLDSLEKQISMSNDVQSTLSVLLKYGNFAVSVINAKTNDDAVQALEAAALPVGSYRIKRKNFFNISVNAYGGVFFAHETFNYNAKPVFGATAPVGLYFGLGKDRDYKENCCIRRFGLFVSLLDVGSVFAFRLNGDTSPLPELSWQNIIAPGLNLVYNFPKLPLTFMGGYQKGSELRKFATEEITNNTSMLKEKVVKTIIDPYAGRFHFSVLIDIPIFNIYTKANYKK